MKGKLLNIIIHPNKILRTKSKEINLEKLQDPKFKQFLLDLELTMIKKDGAGLAAPQVGANDRVIVINDHSQNIFMINPIITKKSVTKITEPEGCLSVLNDKGELFYQDVSRHKWLNCKYYNEKGKLKKIKAKDYLARVIQHEVDHLDGILFIDY
jgi:peptide deformylase